MKAYETYKVIKPHFKYTGYP